MVNATAKAQAIYRQNHGTDPELLSTSADVDRVISELLSGPEYHTLAQIHSLERSKMPSGFFDHELMVGVSRELQVGAVTYMDETGNYVTAGNSDSRLAPVYHIVEHRREFPEQCEIPLDLVREVVWEFISSGGQRPHCVPWKPMVW